MSNYEYEDEDDDITTNDSSNDLVKQLRKAAKQKDKELQELRSQFETLNKGQRERAIKDALAARGVNQKIASFDIKDIISLLSFECNNDFLIAVSLIKYI